MKPLAEALNPTRRRRLAGLFLSTLLIAGCGGGGEDGDATVAGAPAPAPGPAAPSPAPSAPVPSPAAPSPAPAVPVSYSAYLPNDPGDPFDTGYALELLNGTLQGPSIAGSYSFAYPSNGSSGCTVLGGSGASALTACVEFEQANLVQTCTRVSDAFPAGVLVRTDVGRTITEATLAELVAHAGSAGLQFRVVTCAGGTSADDQFTLHADGSADSHVVDGGQANDEHLSASTVAEFFSAQGVVESDGQRAGLKAYKGSSGGTTRYYVVFFAARPAGGSQIEPPGLFAQVQPE